MRVVEATNRTVSERRYTSKDVCTNCWYDSCESCRGNGCVCQKYDHPGGVGVSEKEQEQPLSEPTEVRECVCGQAFTVVVKYARPWTVCPDCMRLDHPLETSTCWGDPSVGSGGSIEP